MKVFKGIEFEETVVKKMILYEGFEFEEAVLTYGKRKKLPASAFCGPNRTYPAHDAAHVRNAFARLSTFGHRLSRGVVSRIHGCLTRRAKRFGVEHKGCKWCKKKQKVEETVAWFQRQHKDLFEKSEK
jgi:hypothetical protein